MLQMAIMPQGTFQDSMARQNHYIHKYAHTGTRIHAQYTYNINIYYSSTIFHVWNDIFVDANRCNQSSLSLQRWENKSSLYSLISPVDIVYFFFFFPCIRCEKN